MIIKALARQWGTTPGTNGGKNVFATLRTTDPRPASDRAGHDKKEAPARVQVH